MKDQKIVRLLTLVFTLAILATLTLTPYAMIDDSFLLPSTNVPDSQIDRRDATTGLETGNDTGTIPEETMETDGQTGAVDDAIDKASEAIDDVTGALGDMKDDAEDAVDDMDNGNSIMGVVIAILIAVAVIILVIVMVSKNTGKHNR